MYKAKEPIEQDDQEALRSFSVAELKQEIGFDPNYNSDDDDQNKAKKADIGPAKEPINENAD